MLTLYPKTLIACNKMTRSTNIIELKNLGKFLYKMKCKCENQLARIVQILEEERETAL
jgi:hypothetical protein